MPVIAMYKPKCLACRRRNMVVDDIENSLEDFFCVDCAPNANRSVLKSLKSDLDELYNLYDDPERKSPIKAVAREANDELMALNRQIIQAYALRVSMARKKGACTRIRNGWKTLSAAETEEEKAARLQAMAEVQAARIESEQAMRVQKVAHRNWLAMLNEVPAALAEAESGAALGSVVPGAATPLGAALGAVAPLGAGVSPITPPSGDMLAFDSDTMFDVQPVDQAAELLANMQVASKGGKGKGKGKQRKADDSDMQE